MLLNIDKNCKTTIFEQIYVQIIELINQNTLKVGERLPSTRKLAKTIGVNRSTIIQVYEELWAQGFIESSQGSYTKVRKRQPIIPLQNKNESIDSLSQNTIYKDNLDLQYDLMMYYLENGKQIEEGKINFLQFSLDSRILDQKIIKSCMREALNTSTPNPFDYAHARGYQPLRQEISKHMKLHNIHAEDENILLTNNTLQSLQLIFQVFSKPGDYIILENPTNTLILLFAKIFKLNIVEITMTETGIDLNTLKQKLQVKPIRFIYTMPTYQNPTGISMPQKLREELLQICADKDCIIIEDSIEEEMNYGGKAFLPIKSIDKRGQVIYLGTFAKVISPGMQIGWIIGSKECIKKLTVLKSIFEISSNLLHQIFLYHYFNKGAFEHHLRKTIREFKKRMKVAIDSVKKHIPAEKIEWSEPNGGYMIWLKLLTKPVMQIENLFSGNGVMIHNGQYFFNNIQSNNYIRICISQMNESEIEDGIRKIGEVINMLE